MSEIVRPGPAAQRRRILEDAHTVHRGFTTQVRLGEPEGQSRHFERGVLTQDQTVHRKEITLERDALRRAGLWVLRWTCRKTTETDLVLVGNGDEIGYGAGDGARTTKLRLEVIDCSAQDIIDVEGPGAQPVALVRPLDMVESVPANGGDIVGSPYLPDMLAAIPTVLASRIEEQQVCLDWLAAMRTARPAGF